MEGATEDKDSRLVDAGRLELASLHIRVSTA